MESPEGSSQTWQTFLQLRRSVPCELSSVFLVRDVLNGERKMPGRIIEMKKI
jgi:hypothetical protein